MYPSSLATPKIARIPPPNLATPRIEPCATYREAWASKYVKKYTCNISTFLWRAEIRRNYPKRDLSFCTSIRGYSFVGPCLQSWFRGTLQNKLREKMTTQTDKTCDMIVYIIPTYLLAHLYLTTNKTITYGSMGTAAPNPG